MRAERFRLEKDDDGHDYLVQADKHEEFQRWLESEAAMDGEEPPAWAKRLNMHPSCYSFTDFREDR